MVPRAGVEPARPFGQRILSPQRLPFRHPGMLSVTVTIPRISVSLKQEYLNVENVGAWKMRGYSINFFYKGQPLSPPTKDYWARQELTS